jgi:hypothetical protein
MIVKCGCVVSHSVATEWGIGKVIELNALKATIQFNDGLIRKIISSHFVDLQPADPACYVPPAKLPLAGTSSIKAAPKKAKKPKVVKELKVVATEV